MTRRHPAVVTALLAALPLLAACAEEDRFERYCDVVRDQQDDLGRVLDADGGSAGLLPALPIFQTLEQVAPDDIADDWSILVGRLGSLADALEDAGVDPGSYDPVDPPDGVTEDQREAIAAGASSVATEAVREALANVTQQARDVCGTELVQRAGA